MGKNLRAEKCMALKIGSLLLMTFASTTSFGVAPNYLGTDLDYKGVGGIHHLNDPFFNASGVAIGPRHALTAKHVGGTRFTVDGELHTWIRRYNHPVYDISVLEFAEDLPTWFRIADSSAIGATLTMVGYGGTGWVNGAGNAYIIDTTRNSTRRKANSILDFKWADPNFNVPHLMTYLVQDGSAVAVGGDSGGGFFINGELAGITSAFFSTNESLPQYGFASRNGGVPYFGTAAVDLTHPDTRAWVDSIVYGFALTLNKSSVAGQNSVLGTILLGEVKATNTVFTTYDNSSLVTTPPSVTVLAGQISRNFQITTAAITSTVVTTIYARLGAVTLSKTLTLNPLIPTALAFTPNPVTGGQTTSCRVVINGVAGPGGRVISIFDNSPHATTPSTVTVPAGATQVIFPITTTTVTAVKYVTVTARVSAGEKTGSLRINP